MTIFYKPKNGYFGDPIPFYENGKFIIIYIFDKRNDRVNEDIFFNTNLQKISTTDFLKFSEHGLVLEKGSKEDQDFLICNGSIIKVNNIYHFFYCGANLYFPSQGKHLQAIMHATSQDLKNWKKIDEDTFYPRQDIYEPDDFRDPFVFWNEESREYWMVVTARVKKGPKSKRGCLALCTSRDLSGWKVREPFWSPHLYYGCECPEIFKIGDWWYIVFSEFNDSLKTRYRMSRSLKGPWISPTNDSFDSNNFYAGKTCSNGDKRFIFGWANTKVDENDNNNWQWGGNLVVHEVLQGSKGELLIKIPTTIDNNFSKKSFPEEFHTILGKWKIEDNMLSCNSLDSYSYMLSSKKMPQTCKISSLVEFSKGTKGCGVILRADHYEGNGYFIKFEPQRYRLVFDLWPRKEIVPFNSTVSDSPFIVGSERPIRLMPDRKYEIIIIVDGDLCVTYLNKEIAMTSRIYNLKSGRWGIFVSEGSAKFYDLKILRK